MAETDGRGARRCARRRRPAPGGRGRESINRYAHAGAAELSEIKTTQLGLRSELLGAVAVACQEAAYQPRLTTQHGRRVRTLTPARGTGLG
ncbi:MAG TPA: hypothetical protein VIT65_04930 [Microlunatus sp.]